MHMNKKQITIDTIKIMYLAASRNHSCTTREAVRCFNWAQEYAKSIIDFARANMFIETPLELLLDNKMDECTITPKGEKTLLDFCILNREGLMKLEQLDNHLERVVRG